ncbi:Cysteine rich PDZ binding protein [Echinococcus multilocularis]|uniref:Cysteine-rich PDZ-binding protein n=1 Tax=Echinococcus multilocularis TaxID=6211 RepID=A0A068Y8F8_ECHMU|nr:Cysteine rich PDZ binding protein [Echinococcus multilocularis]
MAVRGLLHFKLRLQYIRHLYIATNCRFPVLRSSFASSNMVCEKCEKKLVKIATPDPWKAGSRAAAVKGPRRLNENKLLTAKKGRYNPYSKAFRKCRICGQSVHQPEAHYCQSCAFKKGICAMCGVRLVDTTNYNQCAV